MNEAPSLIASPTMVVTFVVNLRKKSDMSTSAHSGTLHAVVLTRVGSLLLLALLNDFSSTCRSGLLHFFSFVSFCFSSFSGEVRVHSRESTQ